MDVRAAYLAAIPTTRDLIAEAADRWDEPSALAGMSVGDLCAHTGRAVSTVARYLDDAPPTGGAEVDAAGYFLAIEGLGDPDSDANRGVRERAASESAVGPHSVIEALDEHRADLMRRLPAESPDRTVSVFAGLVIDLDDYLVTRMVELVVHGDDLTASLGLPDGEYPPPVTDLVVDTLTTIARRRHGDLATIRAMTRRERDHVGALRVL